MPASVLETDAAAGLPQAYLDLLTKLGWGDFGPGQLMFYTGAIGWDEEYSGEPPAGRVFLVADDYQGYTYGFLDGRFTSFDPSGQPEDEERDFEAWLRWHLAPITEDG